MLLAAAEAGLLAVGGCHGTTAQPANPSGTVVGASDVAQLDGLDATVGQIEHQMGADGAAAG